MRSRSHAPGSPTPKRSRCASSSPLIVSTAVCLSSRSEKTPPQCGATNERHSFNSWLTCESVGTITRNGSAPPASRCRSASTMTAPSAADVFRSPRAPQHATSNVDPVRTSAMKREAPGRYSTVTMPSGVRPRRSAMRMRRRSARSPPTTRTHRPSSRRSSPSGQPSSVSTTATACTRRCASRTSAICSAAAVSARLTAYPFDGRAPNGAAPRSSPTPSAPLP